MKTLIAFTLLIITSSSFASTLPEIQCHGTEPFWGISINSQLKLVGISYPLGRTPKAFNEATLVNALGTSGDFAFQVTATDSDNTKLKLNVVKTVCNDGMSDTEYPYTVMVNLGETVLFGCCE